MAASEIKLSKWSPLHLCQEALDGEREQTLWSGFWALNGATQNSITCGRFRLSTFSCPFSPQATSLSTLPVVFLSLDLNIVFNWRCYIAVHFPHAVRHLISSLFPHLLFSKSCKSCDTVQSFQIPQNRQFIVGFTAMLHARDGKMVPSGSSEMPLQLNPWENHALDVSSISSPLNLGASFSESSILILCNQYQFPSQPASSVGGSNSFPPWVQLQDSVIYPGIYSASGLDVMGILVRTPPLFYFLLLFPLGCVPFLKEHPCS